MWTSRAAFALLASLAVACATNRTDGGGDHACTAIGCDDGVSLDLGALTTKFPNAPLAIHVCLDDACQDATVTASSCDQAHVDPNGPVPALVLLCMPYGDGHVHILANATSPLADPSKTVLAIAVTDATGAKVYEHAETVTLKSTQPNGPDCEPTCHQGSFAVP